MKKKRKLRKDRVISTCIPLIFLVILGGILGNKINTKTHERNTNNQQANITSKNNVEDQNNLINEIEKDNKTNNRKDENIIAKNTSHNTGSDVRFDETVAFIGDSRTQGFVIYNGLKNVQDYSYIGLTVDTAISKKFVKTSNGEKITLLEDMKSKNIEKVYIMLGINELGWSYPQVFKSKYKELINKIREIKPNCEIYVQSIIPVTKTRDKSDKYFNNTRIEQYNKLIEEVVADENVKYLDVKKVLVNSDGYLPEETSPDGIHMGPNYCQKWLEYLRRNS